MIKKIIAVLLLLGSYAYVGHTGIKLGNRHGLKMADAYLSQCVDSLDQVPPEEIAQEIGLKQGRLTANMAYGYYAGKVLGCLVTKMENQ